MGPEIFHHDHRLRAVEVEHLRRQAGRVAGLLGQRPIFEPATLERQRPGFADQPHVGQRLLDHDAVTRPLDDEDEIEIAVADLADAASWTGAPPSFSRAAGISLSEPARREPSTGA